MTTTQTDTERADLLAQLATAREALLATVDGLTDEQLGERPTASALCLGGLVKHVASIEAMQQRFITGGASAVGFDLPDGVTWQDIFAGTATTVPQWMVDHEQEFRMLPGDTAEGIVARYREIAARTEEIVAAVQDLSFTQPLPEAPWNAPGETRSVRRVLTQLVMETAHHAGHADIIRESIDGRTAGLPA